MPVSNTQRGQADGAIRSIHAGVGSERVYRQVMAVRPKGFRASILKLIDWPTSWGVLYDLSPAQISQNREAEAARETWEATGTSYAGGANKARMWMTLLGAYFLGQPEPMSESNFPSWRKPSWMTDEEQRRIKEFIRASYEADAPLAQTMPVEDEPEESQVATTVSQQADDGEGSEPFENEGAQESGQAQENPFESLYALYQAYWRRVFLIRDAEDLRERINYRAVVKNAAVTIYALEKLGYEYTGIKNLLQAMANRGLGVVGIRPGNRNGFNAYLLLDLKAQRGSATKYRSGVAYNIMAETCRTSVSTLKGQFERSDRRNLQVFKFSGSGARLIGVQVISMNYMNGGSNADTYQEGNRKVRVARDEARAQVAENLGAVGTESSSAPSASSGTDQYSFMAFQTFPERQTFMQEGQLFRKGNLNGQRQSTVFYFAKRNANGTYTLYRCVFGVAELNVLRFDNTTMGIEGLKRAWNESGKLLERDKITIQRVPVLDLPKLKRAYLALLQNQISSRAFKPMRSQEDTFKIPFDSIVRMTLEVNDALLDSFPGETAQSTSSSSIQSNSSPSISMILTKEQMISSARVKFENHTFGWELEGYVKESTHRRAADALNRVAPEGALRFKGGEATTMPVNGGQYGLVRDTSITHPDRRRGEANRKDEGYEDYTTAEFVSPVLEGIKGLNLVKKCCEAMNSAGVRVNSSDGLHIHFDGHGRGTSPVLKAWQMSNMVINYHVLWPVIDRIQNVTRTGRNTGWAADWPENKIEEFKAFSDAKSNDYKKLYREIYGGYPIETWAVGAAPKYHGSRYRAVNLHGTVTPAGTIEFRHGSPTTDYLYIQNWILFLYHLIEVSKKGYFKKPSSDVNSASYLKDVWSYCELMLPDDVASFIANETYIIDGESVEEGEIAKRRTR